jgi:spermidine/putrescine ABC transporter ATP-binding subunit
MRRIEEWRAACRRRAARRLPAGAKYPAGGFGRLALSAALSKFRRPLHNGDLRRLDRARTGATVMREEAALQTRQRRASLSGQLMLSRLTKRYPNQVAVDALDLEVEAGEFLTLLGPSGSGKTTTLMMVAGFTSPSEGDILLSGRSIAGLAPERRNIGVVFQNYALFPHMTVADNVGFPLKMRGQPRSLIEEKVRGALRLVRLEGLEARLPKQLSGGQQQRVAFARALVFDPDLLLMDEPLGALDKNLREQMKLELKRIHAQLGVTVLYVTHDQEEALTMSDRVALMNDGVIAQLGTAHELYERPATRFVAEFIGESNVIEGALEAAGTFVSSSGLRFAFAGRESAAVGSRAILVARPEKLALTRRTPDEQNIRGEVRERVYVGDFTRYRVEVAKELVLTVKTQNNRSAVIAEEGEAVELFLDPADARILQQ